MAIVIAAFYRLPAQNSFSEHKVGQVFSVSMPDYMIPTSAQTSGATVQYQCLAKDVASTVTQETKESLELVQLKFGSAQEYFDYIMKTFLKDLEQREIGKSKTFKVGGATFVQCEASCYLPDAKMKVVYLETVTETPTCFYQVLSWTDEESMAKLKDGLNRIATSTKEVACR